jgi:hypothetical protein
MARRHIRAQIILNTATGRSAALIKACQTQVADTRDVCTEALSGTYTPEQGFADATALWLNGAAIIAAFYGIGTPPSDP